MIFDQMLTLGVITVASRNTVRNIEVVFFDQGMSWSKGYVGLSTKTEFRRKNVKSSRSRS